MVTKKGRLKLGGRGSLHPGDIGVVRDVDEDLKAGGRVQVQNIKTGDSYWYDMEEICRAFQGERWRSSHPQLRLHSRRPRQLPLSRRLPVQRHSSIMTTFNDSSS